jgi:hypothetical protein
MELLYAKSRNWEDRCPVSMTPAFPQRKDMGETLFSLQRWIKKVFDHSNNSILRSCSTTLRQGGLFQVTELGG